MALEFGIWDHFEQQDPERVPLTQQYAERLDLIVEAERLGFSRYHIAEHHLTPLDMAPSRNLFLAAVARETSRIRSGSMVMCLPLYNPVRTPGNLSAARLGLAEADVRRRQPWTYLQLLELLRLGRTTGHVSRPRTDGPGGHRHARAMGGDCMIGILQSPPICDLGTSNRLTIGAVSIGRGLQGGAATADGRRVSKGKPL